jgi:uncharacterized membrane protein
MKKNIALLCYLTWIGWLVAIFLFSVKENRDSYTRFHVRQSFGLGLLSIICYVIFLLFDDDLFYFSLPSLLVFILLFVWWMLGFTSAMNEKEKSVPVIRKYFQQWFAFIK